MATREPAGNATAWKPWRNPRRPRATLADDAALYAHNPSLTDHLPWVEYLDAEQCFLLDDNRSVGALFELTPIGTEGREPDWLMTARDAVEDALQDSFDELEASPWVVQFFCQDDGDFTPHLNRLTAYIQDRARGSALTEAYLELTRRHLKAVAKPDGLFDDKVVTHLPWRGNNRRVRLVLYRWVGPDDDESGLAPIQALRQACERIGAALRACGVQSLPLDGRGLYAWLLPWFNPAPALTDETPAAFYAQVAYPEIGDGESLELPFDHDFAERLFFNEPRSDVQRGLWYFDGHPHRVMVVVQLKPGAPVSLAPYADAVRLVEQPDQVASLSVEVPDDETTVDHDEQRDILGELEITARLMITGGEAKEEARVSRADRSLIRECILDAAHTCAAAGRQVLTRDIRGALLRVAANPALPDRRRERAQEMGESIDLFCQGFEGELFDREGTPWPESDVTIVDLATYAREGYEAQLSISYISLMNTVNNLAERDQYLGRPIIMVTDEGHIITKHPLLAPFVVKGTKMWRKLGAWFWLATQNLADFPNAAQTMLNMIEWWICLNMPPAEIEEIARFKKLTPAQKALLLSASKEAGKYTEGVVLSKSLETLFRVVPPSLYLALAMTEPEEKAERWMLMQTHNCSELEAAFSMAERIDKTRGIGPSD